MHGMSNTNLLVWYEAQSFITIEKGPNSEKNKSSLHPRYLKFCTHLLMLLELPMRFLPVVLVLLRYRTLS
jgi:hypothetical protein